MLIFVFLLILSVYSLSRIISTKSLGSYDVLVTSVAGRLDNSVLLQESGVY